jgi:hypothetical protein
MTDAPPPRASPTTYTGPFRGLHVGVASNRVVTVARRFQNWVTPSTSDVVRW